VLADALAAQGWTIGSPDKDDDYLVAQRKNDVLAIAIHEAANPGWQQVRGGFADAVLRAKNLAGPDSERRPVAVIAAPRLSAQTVSRVAEYRDVYAPEVLWGVVDDHGLIQVDGILEKRTHRNDAIHGSSEKRVNVWSDIGQCIVKILVTKTVAPNRMRWFPDVEDLSNAELTRRLALRPDHVPEHAPPSRSIVWQVTTQLRRDGFLDDNNRVLRVRELLEVWRHRYEKPARFAMTWPLPGKPPRERLRPLLVGLGRACLAGFTACHEWKLAIVPAGVFDVYVRRIEDAKAYGLEIAKPGERIDVTVRVPATPEAIFRLVSTPAEDGVTAADLIQCWLDLVDAPGRGREQAEVILRTGLGVS
jgi:hypothetical protein